MEAWSPYASNYDNPVRFSDFLGDEPVGPGVIGQIGPVPIPVVEGVIESIGAGLTSLGVVGTLAVFGDKIKDAIDHSKVQDIDLHKTQHQVERDYRRSQ
ncbi:hypothetical protein [[Flexibacter] sp. ATCC 35208]|uniref:hypothetical protein n=1 Tax=[Flexibacter] sp. ATCC 35208 TaxID=1936242 RepID=UPI0009CB0F57|nr:hypothetical protein [[Flexibacter] sp. ATCC 35208]OMP79382.1 hypothetical protein BW716_09815 [[Flexibacter] sp. ATCC 35208]